MKDIDFNDHKKNCPCHDNETKEGQCMLQVSYNGHVNDPRYGSCLEHLCPMFYWLTVQQEYVK